MGEALNGRYTFDAKTGNTTDNSEYQWGIQGSTASVVDNGNGSAISQSGVVPSYTVKSGDAGQVLEMSVLAKNGANVTGNTATVTTVPGSDGNEVDGGGDGGTVVDETAAPSISDVVMSGTLKVGEALNGRYTFDAKTGDPTDTSEYQWGIQGSTASVVDNENGSAISVSGVVPSYTIQNSDVGQVLEVSVRAKNGAGVYGNSATVDTAQTGDGNNTTGGDAGKVVGIPALKNIVANDYTFELSSGFPTIGFIGAAFTLNVEHDSAENYTWVADAQWVTVNNGVVSFISMGNKKPVTITGTSKDGITKLEYTFTLNKWTMSDSNPVGTDWSTANRLCQNNGYALATRQQISGSSTSRGNVGYIWSEWGAQRNYTGSSFKNSDYWTSDAAGSNKHYGMGLGNNLSSSSWGDSDGGTHSAMCIKGL